MNQTIGLHVNSKCICSFLIELLYRKDDFINTVKLSFMTINKNNLSIFGISKVKTLTDFVTTEQDVKKGNNRLPLNLARMYEEDLMTKEEVEKAKVEMKM